MKKLIVIAMLTLVLPLNVAAQDDLYFVPTKANVKKTSENYGMPKDTYYCGSSRDVDEYNRRLRSSVQPIDGDSAANDAISFDAVRGEYPDSLAALTEDDYKYTRKMSRWDDDYRNAYWYGYTDGRFDRWYGWSTFYDPWYYGSWYGGWYDPWYAGWHSYYGWGGWYGWYDPWYYGWGGYYPHHTVIIGGGGHNHNVASSTFRSHGTGHSVMGTLPSGSNRLLGNSATNHAASRSFSSGISSRDRQINGARNSSRTTTRVNNWYNRQNTNNSNNTSRNTRDFGSSRSNSSYNSGSFGGSGSSRSGSFGGGSFSGGSRGGGSFSGGGARNGGRR